MGIKKTLILGSLIATAIICRGANPTLSGTNTYTGQETYTTTNEYYPNGGPQILGGFWLNNIYYTNLNQGSNSIAVTNVITDPAFTNAVYNIQVQYLTTNGLIWIEQCAPVPLVSTTGTTNNYRIDFGYLFGGPIYGTVEATNLYTCFLGITNATYGKLYSLNVVASNIATTLMIPQIFPHFNTNGWSNAITYWTQVLNTNCEFRMTIHSNITLSTTYAFFGQGLYATNGVNGTNGASGVIMGAYTNTLNGVTYWWDGMNAGMTNNVDGNWWMSDSNGVVTGTSTHLLPTNMTPITLNTSYGQFWVSNYDLYFTNRNGAFLIKQCH